VTHDEFLRVRDGILYNSQAHNNHLKQMEEKRINKQADQQHEAQETLKRVV
jgi:hypothetical protein